MKLSRDDLIAKVNEKVMDEDVKIELMEDITDSFAGETESEDNNERVKELEEKLRVMTEKYKERFLKGDEEKKEVAEEKEVDEEMKEEEIIDVKEI